MPAACCRAWHVTKAVKLTSHWHPGGMRGCMPVQSELWTDCLEAFPAAWKPACRTFYASGVLGATEELPRHWRAGSRCCQPELIGPGQAG